MTKTYEIIDILHTGYSGTARTSKVGKKYDLRRNKTFTFDVCGTRMGDHTIFWDEKNEEPFLFTTEYAGFSVVGDLTEIYTKNSIYIVKEVVDEGGKEE